jgi:hypothetical protein
MIPNIQFSSLRTLVVGLVVGMVPMLIYGSYMVRSLLHARRCGIALLSKSAGAAFRVHLREDEHARLLYRRSVVWFFISLATWGCVAAGAFCILKL